MAAGAWTRLRRDAERKTGTKECAVCSHLYEVQKQGLDHKGAVIISGGRGRVG